MFLLGGSQILTPEGFLNKIKVLSESDDTGDEWALKPKQNETRNNKPIYSKIGLKIQNDWLKTLPICMFMIPSIPLLKTFNCI